MTTTKTTIGRTIAAAALAAALTIGSVSGVGATTPAAAKAAPKAPVSTLAACKYEDGSSKGQRFPCLWDATVRGNHRGDSYVFKSKGVMTGSVLDVGVDPGLRHLLDAGLELYKLAVKTPVKQRTAAMRKAIHDYEQYAD